MEYSEYITEGRNEKSTQIDKMSSYEMVALINSEDKMVADAVEKELANIASAIDMIVPRLKSGGHLVYIGAGTSGRLGILDASECPPTYGVSPELVHGIIAGGDRAVFRSVENAEDNAEAAIHDLIESGFGSKDVCFGISASGSAMYVRAALEYAKTIGAGTVSLSCNPASKAARIAEIAINPIVGPEVVSGSTRMKAGTAQKMVLNMISTGVMIKLGRVSGNLLVHMKPTNTKLRDRASRIITAETGADADTALKALDSCSGDISAAIDLLKH